MPWQRLVAFGIAVVLLIGFWLFLKRTRLGWALRACAQDREAAALQGMSINKLALLAMGARRRHGGRRRRDHGTAGAGLPPISAAR